MLPIVDPVIQFTVLVLAALVAQLTVDRLLVMGLATSQAATTLAIAITAQEAGIVPGTVVDAAILLLLVTCVAGPLLTAPVESRVADRG
jgi:hypothetical protein